MSTDRAPFYLDDLTPGFVYRPEGETGPLTVEAITAYAREFDPQPFHLDHEAARATLFQGLAASGWHTASLTMQLIVRFGLPLAGGVVGGGVDELRWPRPVRPGDRLHIENEVIEVRVSKSKPDQGLVKMKTTTFNQNNEPVMVMTANLIVPRRPAE
ncbi:MAG TPA: MaoC family dehydratase [Pseudolabrys sp.]|nr:MaoC family dehydratase [Pseudolabrys sp.]